MRLRFGRLPERLFEVIEDIFYLRLVTGGSRDPLRPHDAFPVYNEVRPLREAGLMHYPIVLDHLAPEVREQREAYIPLLSPRLVRPGRVGAYAQNFRALLLEASDLLLQLTHPS